MGADLIVGMLENTDPSETEIWKALALQLAGEVLSFQKKGESRMETRIWRIGFTTKGERNGIRNRHVHIIAQDVSDALATLAVHYPSACVYSVNAAERTELLVSSAVGPLGQTG